MQTKIDWSRIESFVGYGRVDAPVVFVGIEEGLSAPERLNDDLARRSQFEPLMDLKSAHEGICHTEQLFDVRDPKCQRTWRPMCDLMLRRAGAMKPPTLELRSHYQALKLGRRDGETLLAELLPYPHVRAKDWEYARFDRYRNRQEYETAILPRRLDLLGRILASANRDLIVCYGKSKWDSFKAMIANTFAGQVAAWQPYKNGLLETAVVNRTRIVLTCHLSSSRFNSEAQLTEFAAAALEKSTRESVEPSP